MVIVISALSSRQRTDGRTFLRAAVSHLHVDVVVGPCERVRRSSALFGRVVRTAPRVLAYRVEVYVLQEQRARPGTSLRQVALPAGVVPLRPVAADRLPVAGEPELGCRGAVAAVSHQDDGGAPLRRVVRDDERRMPAGDGDDGQSDVGQHAGGAVVEPAERVHVGRVEHRCPIPPALLVDVYPVQGTAVWTEAQPH